MGKGKGGEGRGGEGKGRLRGGLSLRLITKEVLQTGLASDTVKTNLLVFVVINYSC